MSEQPDVSASNQIIQTTQGDRNQTIGQVHGGIVVYVSGGQAVINPAEVSATAPTKRPLPELGPNPYKGLLAFNENDGDRYFGRADEIQTLWEKFRDLQISEGKTRLLPIYGPSGSGKSSLARAGLLPELGRRPLPGREQARVAVLVPGNDPLYSLAVVLAKIAKEDPNPVEKADEFKRVLKKSDDSGEFNGLNRIAFGLPDIATSPLIVLVDQFEEIYSYEPKGDGSETQQKREKFIAERDIFIKNLLHAAADSSRYVSVIITCRSDFLGATQQYPELNKLFSTQGFLVPIMQQDALAEAIIEPTKQTDYRFNPATVQLLVEQTHGHKGALPLLQFALLQIWEGLKQGIDPAYTLKQIGGVGGALANEAKHIYTSLLPDQQVIARSIFLAVIQLNEDRTTTRRRAVISELVTQEHDEAAIRAVIYFFARPGVWILVTSANEDKIEMVEVAHEALIHNWQELQDWLQGYWEILRKQRKLDEAVLEWEKHKKSPEYLLQGKILRDAKDFLQSCKGNREVVISTSTFNFIEASNRRRVLSILKLVSAALIFPLAGTLIFIHLQIIDRANSTIIKADCKPDPGIKWMLEYMWWTRYAEELRDVQLCNEDLLGIKLPGVFILNANFDGSNLSNSNFRNARLPFSSFRGSSLGYADFSGQTLLTGADFRCQGSDCTTLFEANLENADLSRAQLQGSFLEGAVLKGANLTNANLEDARALIESQLEGVILCKTKMPDYLSHVSGNRDCSH